MIEIWNLSFHYGDGDFSLRLPQLTVDDGASVAFVGPSGSGKTTLLNPVSGVLRPETGALNI
jgi:ABC-type bacteriocin/lantibiotic exporter with double-glycine peptidase domain